jgi:hypothetical protein
MLVYNVTIKVDAAIAEEWLSWLQEEHVANVMATKCFSSYKILRLLDLEDGDGPTYVVQYKTATKELLDKYLDEFSQDLRQEGFGKWGNQFIAFRTIMQEII